MGQPASAQLQPFATFCYPMGSLVAGGEAQIFVQSQGALHTGLRDTREVFSLLFHVPIESQGKNS